MKRYTQRFVYAGEDHEVEITEERVTDPPLIPSWAVPTTVTRIAVNGEPWGIIAHERESGAVGATWTQWNGRRRPFKPRLYVHVRPDGTRMIAHQRGWLGRGVASHWYAVKVGHRAVRQAITS